MQNTPLAKEDVRKRAPHRLAEVVSGFALTLLRCLRGSHMHNQETMINYVHIIKYLRNNQKKKKKVGIKIYTQNAWIN